MNLGKTIIAAAAIAAAPVMALAVPITGDVSFSGSVDLANSDFNAGGNVDFLSQVGMVNVATGDFAAVDGQLVDLTDIDFNMPGEIFSVGGFTFTADSFREFVDGVQVQPGIDFYRFTATGTLSGNGFDDTMGMLAFSAQSVNGAPKVSFSSTAASVAAVPVPAAGLLLLFGLGGVAAVSRRKKADA